MGRRRIVFAALSTVFSLAITAGLSTTAAHADPQRAGVVTTLKGTVTVTRASAPAAELRFRDDVFARDRIKADDHSMARILLGGKAVVTIGEHSIVSITEVPGTSTIDLTSGRIALAVAKNRMARGESIDIRTPHGIAGVRGTVVVAEVIRIQAGDGPGAFSSRFTVLRGLVDVSTIDPASRQAVGTPVRIGALQSVGLDAAGKRDEQTITPEAAQRMVEPFKAAPREAAPVARPLITEIQVREAIAEVTAILGPDHGTGSATREAKVTERTRENDQRGNDRADDSKASGGGDLPKGDAKTDGRTEGANGDVKKTDVGRRRDTDLTRGQIVRDPAKASFSPDVKGLSPDVKALTPDFKTFTLDVRSFRPDMRLNPADLRSFTPDVRPDIKVITPDTRALVSKPDTKSSAPSVDAGAGDSSKRDAARDVSTPAALRGSDRGRR